MARYAISAEGVESLRRLANSLNQETQVLDEAAGTLFNATQSVEDGLGEYQLEILVLLEQIIAASKNGKEAIEQLTKVIIPKQIQKIESYLHPLATDESDDDDEPPVKKLVLRRRL